MGGSGGPHNTRLRCAAHNLHGAKKMYGREKVEAKVEESRKRTETKRTIENAVKALVSMGFKTPRAQEAMAKVAAAHAEEPLPDLVELLREAIGLLT
jgi:Holliday junction resolvasome RuvABC DNA-binding subunit